MLSVYYLLLFKLKHFHHFNLITNDDILIFCYVVVIVSSVIYNHICNTHMLYISGHKMLRTELYKPNLMWLLFGIKSVGRWKLIIFIFVKKKTDNTISQWEILSHRFFFVVTLTTYVRNISNAKTNTTDRGGEAIDEFLE